MTKLYLALVLVFLTVTGAPISVFAQEQYLNTTHLFVIIPPSGWTVNEKPPDEVRFELKADGTPVAYLQVVATTLKSVVPLMDAISAFKQGWANATKNAFLVAGERNVKIAGVDAYEIVFMSQPWVVGVPVRAKVVLLLRGDKLYSMIYASTEKDYARYLADADRSTGSFRFIEKLTLDAEPRIASVTVDQKTYSPKDLPKGIFFIVGDTHTITVESTIPGATGTRYVFLEWSDGKKETSRTITITKPETYTAKYKTQYELTVESEKGNPQGAGWYDAGSEGSFSVTSPIPESGFMGTLGARIVFDHWSGDSSAPTPTATIKMDGPKTVTAIWKTNYTQAYIILGAIAAVVVLAIVGVVVVMRRRAPPSPPPPVPPPAAAAQKYCVQCGSPMPMEATHCPRCGAKQ